jgi:hypothetical protein
MTLSEGGLEPIILPPPQKRSRDAIDMVAIEKASIFLTTGILLGLLVSAAWLATKGAPWQIQVMHWISIVSIVSIVAAQTIRAISITEPGEKRWPKEW